MSTIPRISTLSLRSKLVLSYLLVIVGTVIVFIFAIALAVQNYIYNAQLHLELGSVTMRAQTIERIYQLDGGWTDDATDAVQKSNSFIPSDEIQIVKTVPDNQLYGVLPYQIAQNNENSKIGDSILQNATQTQKTQSGTVQVKSGNTTESFLYVSIPLKTGDQVIGAIYLAEPTASDNILLSQINIYVILAGLIVAIIASACSFLFVRRFIRPLQSLTMAAEQMKQGQYTERVPIPASQDEVGRLALTFNEMADTIESDMGELRRQDQMRRDLIANIAHDLATPLTAIQGLSEALADDVVSDMDARQETAQRIGREIQRLRRLVADVRQMTLMEARQIQLDLAPLDLQALVDETIIVIAPECEQKGIAIQNNTTPATPPVLADSDRVTQVLLNLLDNARRHTPAGGTISVSATTYHNELQVTVNDTGVGINATDLPHIFERFYRADRSRTSSTGGSGLGLSIVKAIITAHNGRIWAESTPGQGTRITFTLPLAPQTTATLPTTSQQQTQIPSPPSVHV
ncbi:MAG TPA: HAMP domain-containing sensor histidine kinase [Dictyobacter sp.]|jgi:signal transduction histidine kinase|nr:HAMP domain-containing sensor histidine kinase [Dictyobacter sp.]